MAETAPRRQIPALKVNQWLPGWNRIQFSPKHHRAKPLPYFYVFSLSAQELRSLCGIVRRQASGVVPRAADLGIQRQHDEDRSEEIAQFVEFGYPWSTLSEAKRKTAEFDDLRKPGWLPTAIVINILHKSDERRGDKVAEDDLITLHDDGGACTIRLPYPSWTKTWRPSAVPPLEVIDGQHRLWAFEADSHVAEFEVPVVAFSGLDVSWQAYLFWTINIKPKRINPSLAFDLYPLLRAEDWLDRAEGHPVYRETRSQELTEALWSHPDSPWYDRINMLGERQIGGVTQSAWIKTLMATFVRPWHGRGGSIGGLFGSRLQDDDEVLGWSRAQQAAFLIFAWQKFWNAIHNVREPWANELRADARRHEASPAISNDPAFYGNGTLIATDQGVRGFMHVLNDLCYVMAPNLKLSAWQIDRHRRPAASDTDAVTLALKSIAKEPVATFLDSMTLGLATFDWRTSTAPGVAKDDDLRRQSWCSGVAVATRNCGRNSWSNCEGAQTVSVRPSSASKGAPKRWRSAHRIIARSNL